MKRQISILACLLMIVAMVFAIASCTKPEDPHVHEYVSEVTKEATCTENGELTYACSCGDTYVDEIQAKGHTPGVLPAVEPTCTTAGKTEGYGCTVCGLATTPQSELAPLGHELGAPATCTTAQVCARECGKVFVEALGHKEVAPTCTENGYCSVCDVELKDALGHTEVAATCTEVAYCSVCTVELAPALGHSLEYACLSGFCTTCEMEWVEATAEHEYFYACDTNCMNCYEFTNWEASHTMVFVEAKEPTCTELGNIEYWNCTDCNGCWDNEYAMGVPYNQMMVKLWMVDHEYRYACDAHCMNCYQLTNEEAAHTLNHVAPVAPTCTENGNIEYWTCSDCGGCWDNDQATGMPLNRFMVVVPATGHSYFYECDPVCMVCYEYTNEEAAHSLDYYAAVAPTCTKNGNVEYWQCEFCGTCWDNENMTGMPLNGKMVIVPALGHEYAFDCDPVCIVCHEISNPDAEHDVVHVAAKNPTCTDDGAVEHWYCSYCDLRWIDEDCTTTTSKNSVTIPNLGGHKGYEYDRKCDVCNLYILPEVGEAFKLGLYQATLKKTLYITGEMSGYYYATTTNPYQSPDVFIEEANGGFYMYFMKGTTKTYLYVQMSTSNGETYYNVKFGSTKDVWTFDETLGLFKTVESGSTQYLGTYSDFETFSASAISYISASNVGVSQFPARPEILAPHDCVPTEATCSKAPVCTICGAVVGEKLPHTPGEEATCTTAQVCTVCNAVVTAKLGHTTDDGECERCGETIVKPKNETFKADFNTVSANSSYTSRKTTSGWTGVNCAVAGGGTSDSNPNFKVLGDSSNRGFTMNGNTTAKGKITSPTLNNGISALTFNYANLFSESKGVDITINIKQNGTVVATKRVDNDSVTQLKAYTVTWNDLDVKGDFVIEIVNNSPTNSTSNKDRVCIFNLEWTTNK